MGNKKSTEEYKEEMRAINPYIEIVGTYQGNKMPIDCKCLICGFMWKPLPSNLLRGHGCPVCSKKSSIRKRNDSKIEKDGSFYDWCLKQGERGLLLLSQWDTERNAENTPMNVTFGSETKVFWKCEKGHIWRTSIGNRSKGRNCPVCSNKVINSGENDLATLFPKIAAEWNFIKNGSLLPSMVSYGSEKKVWWVCKKGHQWQTSPNARTFRNSGCPICSNRILAPQETSLLAKYPELAKEWDEENNGSLSPKDVFPSSNKKVWWKCSICGRSWKTSLISRVNGSNCPQCNSRLGTSFPEQVLFYYLKQVYFDAELHYTDDDFGKSELDIFIPSIKTGIEYDGNAFHKTKASEDREKRKYELCKRKGITLIRIKERLAADYQNHCDILIETDEYHYKLKILDELLDKLSVYILIPNHNCEADEFKIKQSFYSIAKRNRLSVAVPQLVSEWDYQKNEGLTPEMFTASSGQRVWWKCDVGHSWRASIDSRTKGHGCPYCFNVKVLMGYNDLNTLFPDLVKEWDYDKNEPLTPNEIMAKSNKKVWWLCSKCGYEWKTSIYNRSIKNTGCPVCVNNVVRAGTNDLASTYPTLLDEWDYDKNTNCSPKDFVAGSTKKVWWKCENGHSWQAIIRSRTRGNGCPFCSVSRKRMVRNDDTGLVYATLTEAAKSCKLSGGYSISLCCQGKRKTAGGYHWSYM